ncbi:hypothetical protein MAR_008848 [Mya arenaria]|uniref:Uncharacterized protein n=1 Tax=Mya arenaria TaxID=6604 RepID=A0ABY7E017_MYAAR|nr:hypothetical protein MAR_008848 [Mya arenaria]
MHVKGCYGSESVDQTSTTLDTHGELRQANFCLISNGTFVDNTSTEVVGCWAESESMQSSTWKELQAMFRVLRSSLTILRGVDLRLNLKRKFEEAGVEIENGAHVVDIMATHILASRADGIVDKYTSYLKAFKVFCDSGRSDAVISASFYAVKWFHSINDLPDPTENSIVKNMLECAKRHNLKPIVKKDVLSTEHIIKLCDIFDERSPNRLNSCFCVFLFLTLELTLEDAFETSAIGIHPPLSVCKPALGLLLTFCPVLLFGEELSTCPVRLPESTEVLIFTSLNTVTGIPAPSNEPCHWLLPTEPSPISTPRVSPGDDCKGRSASPGLKKPSGSPECTADWSWGVRPESGRSVRLPGCPRGSTRFAPPEFHWPKSIGPIRVSDGRTWIPSLGPNIDLPMSIPGRIWPWFI